jgi:hypothetical protein
MPEVLRPAEPEPTVAVPGPFVVPDATPADDGWDEVRAQVEPAAPNGAAHGATIDDLPLASAHMPDLKVEPAEAPSPRKRSQPRRSIRPAGTAKVAEAPAVAQAPAEPAEAVAAPAVAQAPAEPAEAVAAPAEPAWPDHPTWPLPTVDPRTPPPVLGMVGAPEEDSAEPIVDPVPAVPPVGVDPASARVPAGVYLPPSAVLPPAEALPLPGAGAAASDSASAAKPGVARGPLSGLADSLNSISVPADAGSRTIAIGGGIAVLGFLLPWADIVIGSRSLDGGLLSTWGLAGPAAPFAFLLVLGLTALAILRPNLPAWVGLSSAAIALAALLVGILWPYLFGSFGAAVGVYLVAVGALVLVAGGLVDRVTSRHEEPPAGV